MDRLPLLPVVRRVALLVLLAGPSAATAQAAPDSAAIERAVRALVASARDAHDARLAAGVRQFYRVRSFAPAWTTDRGWTVAARQVQTALASASDEGLDSAHYRPPVLPAPASRNAREGLAAGEVALSYVALRFAEDLGWGMTTPGEVHRDNAYGRRAFPAESLLAAWVRAPDAARALLSVAPTSPGYTSLRAALARLRASAQRSPWTMLSPGPTLRPGSTDPRVRELRAALAQRGDLAAQAAESDRFDGPLADAVARFQERHGLTVDSVVGPATRGALNVPIDARLRQIELGMERLRWLPSVDRGRWITVNLADQHAFLLEDGRPVLTSRVVIGALDHKTPMFVDTLTNIVLNPAWNVPPSIVRKEILPKLRRDPRYLEDNHMVRIGNDIQQVPGPWNALGQIAFMFPNRFNVYMHDTPAKALFAENDRTFSHGCIRVQRPHDLATTILEPEGWTRARLDSVIATGARTVVWLRTPIPVRITYATAFADENGTLQFRRDVYGRDALLQQALQQALDRARKPE